MCNQSTGSLSDACDCTVTPRNLLCQQWTIYVYHEQTQYHTGNMCKWKTFNVITSKIHMRLEFKLKICGRGRLHYNMEHKIYWEQNRMIHVRCHILSIWCYISQFSMSNWGRQSRYSILGCHTRSCLLATHITSTFNSCPFTFNILLTWFSKWDMWLYNVQIHSFFLLQGEKPSTSNHPFFSQHSSWFKCL
jgi:hypothetical protein